MSVAIRLKVNGREVEGQVEPRMILADFLRDDLRLTGTHLGCEHGVCGACTILVDGRTANSCLMLAVQADGCEIVTIEGLADAYRESEGLAAAGSVDKARAAADPAEKGWAAAAHAEGSQLHPVQAAFRAEHGLQCGFCTPGMIISAAALLQENPDPTEEQIREHMSGNICRCTGYVFIVKAIQTAKLAMGKGES